MKILAKTGNYDIATVYVADLGEGKEVEFVESVQPPIPIDKKWVLIISTLYGCPVKCRFCDSGGFYKGKVSKEGMIAQIEYLIKSKFPAGKVAVEKFKIQFARMGEPALNPAVLEVLEELPELFDIPGFMPSVSTIAPKGCEKFLEKLCDVKQRKYGKNFQMQFSIHTTNIEQRDWLMPVKKMGFKDIAQYGDKFFEVGDRKITLNFALAEENEADPEVLLQFFDPQKYLIKITPVNPTFQAKNNGLSSLIKTEDHQSQIISKLEEAGYEVLLSIGEIEENDIGSNCGQHLMNYFRSNESLEDSYTYGLENIE